MTKCILDGCVGVVISRAVGLCGKCYQGATDAVHVGVTTWAEIIELGLALRAPTKFPKRGPPRGRFRIALEARRKVRVAAPCPTPSAKRPSGPSPCPRCEQVDIGQRGTNPCQLCGLPEVWER